ncbi:MAG: dephospho-CoA kinase [Ignavibacteriae bacterium]|nr:MAG: dephospho-CoA kinase [Ignavibacteriota bacterium]
MSNKKRLFIGVTGGIGSGKSLACEYFEKYGCKVFYADEIAKQLYHENEELKLELVKQFGEKIIGYNGDIDFNEFRQIVFKSDANQKRVNKIVHPFVIKEILSRADKAKAKIIIKEAALMFESGSYKYNDYNILIYSNAKIRIERVKKKRGLPAAIIKSIMKLQMPEREKKELADFIVNNNLTKRDLEKKVRFLVEVFKMIVE